MKCYPVADCYEDGKVYANGEHLPSDSPCMPRVCYEGTVYTLAIDCMAPPDNCEGVWTEGECCASYAHCGCDVDCVHYESGDYIPQEDPCVSMQCQEGNLVGLVANCPEVMPEWNCEELPPVEGECCPTYANCKTLANTRIFD